MLEPGVLVGMYVPYRYSQRDVVRALFGSCVCVCVVSYLFLSSLLVDDDDDDDDDDV